MADRPESHWKDVIIDHSQFPRRHRRIDNPSHEGCGENPFCGDRVKLQLQVDESGRIRDAGFEATGCAVSMASASLLLENLVGKSIDEAGQLFDRVHASLTADSGGAEELPGELQALGLVKNYPSRVKCATLSWHVLRGALSGEETVVSSE